MSEEQLSALLAVLRDDAELQAKLKGAADLHSAIELMKNAGFDVTKANLLKYQAQQTLSLSDQELEKVAGGGDWVCNPAITCGGGNCFSAC